MIDLDTIGYFLFMEEQEKRQSQGITEVENEETISKEDRPPISPFEEKK